MRSMWICAVAFVVGWPGVAVAQQPARPSSAMVRGVVYDSLARRPLAGAMIQFVARDSTAVSPRSVTSDSLGRFAIESVANGRFLLGFFHPTLDSLGLDLPSREVVIADQRPVAVDLAIPAPATIRGAICPARTDSVAVVLGIVRQASTGNPVDGASVTAEWWDLKITAQGISRTNPSLNTKTLPNGWYAICDVPTQAAIAMLATHDADSTDILDLDIGATALVRRDLFVGTSRTVGDSAAVRDTTLSDSITKARVERRGNARVSGVAIEAVSGRPLSGAEVRLVDGPRTRSNARGEWTLSDVPDGTRMIDVRALGHAPVSVPVDIAPDVAPVRVELSSLKALLDTIRITAPRTSRLLAFEMRRKSGMGRFITAADIERRRPFNVSDLLRMQPGVYLERMVGRSMRAGFDSFFEPISSAFGETAILMRGTGVGRCSANIYLNNMYMGGMTAEELDGFIQPDYVAGIELYSGSMSPPEFTRSTFGGSCGSLIIWTK